jgi:cell division protein FtsB
MENKWLTLFLVAVVLFISLTIRQCRENHVLLEQVKDLADYKSEAKYYKDKNGEIIAYNKSLETSVEALNIQRAELMQELKDMRIKKPQVITSIVSETLIDSVVIPFETRLPCDSQFVQPFSHNDTWFTINGSVTNTHLNIDNIFIQDSLLIVVGEKKNGLFKRNEIIVAVKHSNPHVTTTDIENYIIKPKTRFWQKGWFYGVVFGTGVATGVLIR